MIRQALQQFVDYLRNTSHTQRLFLAGTFIFVVAMLVYALTPPALFPTHSVIHIKEGETLTQIADALEEQHVIKSSLVFKSLTILFGGDSGVLAGDYYFEGKDNIVRVTSRLLKGVYGIDPIIVTIPEGSASYEIAEILTEKVHTFDAEAFVATAEAYEGKLFPDTYAFLPNVDPERVVAALTETFDDRLRSIQDKIKEFGRPLDEVLIIASLVEKEAPHSLEDRRMIAGVLWNRIGIGMPLQVDAVFGYIEKREIFHPSFDDLEVDSPYNTYKHAGLPPGPITNPGLESILAAATPARTNYLYYLTGRDGKMYYSEDFEGHKRNRALYLD